MHRGYIKIWRKIEDSFLMTDPDALWLWVRLLLKANYKPTEFIFNNKKIILDRGQLLTGRKSLVDKHRISESKVYRLLKTFENEHLIEQQKTNLYSIITIVSYNDYNQSEQQSEQPVNIQRTTSEQPVNTSKELIRTKKNDNTLNTSQYDLPIRQVFEYFIKRCQKPNFNFSKERINLISKRLKEGYTVEQLCMAIDNFSKDDWPDRHKYCDFVYVIGFRKGVDNLDRWLNVKDALNTTAAWNGG